MLVVVKQLKPLTPLSGTVYRLTSSLSDHTPKRLITAYFGPKRNEKIFPSLFPELMPSSASSFVLVGKNGSEPTVGNEGRAGGNL